MVKRNNSFAFYTATGRILAMLFNFIVPLFLTRYISQLNYGLYSQFYVVLSFIGTIFAFGFQSNLYYFYPRVSEKEQKSLIGNTLIGLLFFALLAFCFIEIPWTSKLIISDTGLVDFKHIISISTFLFIPSFILFPLFIIKGDKFSSVFLPPLEIVTKVLLVVVATIVFQDVKYIFYCLLIFHLSVFCFVIFYSFFSKNTVQGNWINKDLLIDQLQYTIPFGSSNVLFTLTKQLDKIICISFISLEEFAIYSLAFYGIPGINQVYDSVAEVNLLNMSHSYKNGDKKGTHSLYKSFCTKLLSFSVPLIAIVFLFSPEIFDLLFTKEYSSAVPFFRIYIFSFIFSATGAGTVLRARGKTKYSLLAYLYTMIIYLPFSYFSIKYYGTWGAITTAMIGFIVPKLFLIHYERKLLNVSLKQYMPWRYFARIVIIAVIPLLPIAIAHQIFHFNVWTALIFSVTYLLIVYYIEIKKTLFIVDSSTLKVFFSKFNIKIKI